MTNPFAPQQQAQSASMPQATAPAPAGNPFAAPQPAAPAPTPAPATPQAYAPAPAAANPFGAGVAAAPAPAQAYTPAAPQYAQQAPAAAPAIDLNRLAAAGAPVIGEGRGAKLPDMFGRLLLIFPLDLRRVPRSPQFITAEQRAAGNVEQDRLTATVVVLDAGKGRMDPIAFGGAPHALPPTPHTDSAPLPYVRKGMWINQSRLISQCTSSLPAGPGQAPGMVVGRLTKAGPANNDPWYLIGADEDEIALARTYLELVTQGQYPHPLG